MPSQHCPELNNERYHQTRLSVLLEKAIDRAWEPGKGWKATRTFEGEEAMIQSMANNIIANAGRFVRVDKSPAADLATIS